MTCRVGPGEMCLHRDGHHVHIRGVSGPELQNLPQGHSVRRPAVTVNLKNISGEPVYLGRSDGRRVEDGEVIHVEGKLAAKKDQPEDAVLVGEGDDARLYPHSVWKITGENTKSEPDVPAPSTTEA